MIGKLTGRIDSFGTDHIILDVGGVGYIAFASARTLSRIGDVGSHASLLIHTQVREDAITLYGFADAAEQQWFRILTSVQGVGSKVGLAILSACPADQLSFIIAAQDKAALTRADGVGPKLALRILTELKDKAGSIEISKSARPLTGAESKMEKGETSASAVDQDAVSALTNLGYSASEAYRAVMAAKVKANDNEQDKLDVLIRMALKELSA